MSDDCFAVVSGPDDVDAPSAGHRIGFIHVAADDFVVGDERLDGISLLEESVAVVADEIAFQQYFGVARLHRVSDTDATHEGIEPYDAAVDNADGVLTSGSKVQLGHVFF